MGSAKRLNVIVKVEGARKAAAARAARPRKNSPRALTIYHWHVDTPHFSFDAYGETEIQCRAVMADGWKIHQRQTGATAPFEEIAEGSPRPVVCGVPYRDSNMLIDTTGGRRG